MHDRVEKSSAQHESAARVRERDRSPVSAGNQLLGLQRLAGNAAVSRLVLRQVIEDDLVIRGNTIIEGDVDITGSTTHNGPTETHGEHTVEGTQEVIGDQAVVGSHSVEGGSEVLGSSTVEGDANVTGSLDVGGVISGQMLPGQGNDEAAI